MHHTPRLTTRTALLICGLSCLANLAVGQGLVISNERSGDLVWMDLDGRLVKQQPICHRPRGMASLPDQQLLVACSDDHRVLRVDRRSGEILATYNNLQGAMSVAVFPDQTRALVSNEGDATATVFSLADGSVLATLATGLEPDGVAVSPQGQRLFVVSEASGLISVFDGQTYEPVTAIRTHLRPRRLAVTDSELWVSSEMGSRVEIFDLQTLTKIDEIIFAPRGFRSEQLTPVDILIPPSGTEAYVALGSASQLAVIDRESRAIKQYITVGRRAWGLGWSGEPNRLYVLNGLSDDMTLIDLATLRPIRTVRTGLVPHAVEVFP